MTEKQPEPLKDKNQPNRTHSLNVTLTIQTGEDDTNTLDKMVYTPYACEDCGLLFDASLDLQRHVKIWCH